MKPLSQLTAKEKTARLKKVLDTVDEIKSYLVNDRPKELDYGRVHQYLSDLDPYIDDPDIPQVVLEVAAMLYVEEGRVQMAAQLMCRVRNPEEILMREIDFTSGYYICGNAWRVRQKRIWNSFQGLDQRLRKTTASNTMPLKDLMIAWGACFPTHEVMVIAPSGREKGVINLGLPDGIFSLYPMRYLQNHVPDKVAKDWKVVLEPSEHEQDQCLLGDRIFPADEIRVDIVSNKNMPMWSGDTGKVVLAVWHPYLRDLARQGKAHDAMQSAICCVNASLPQSVRLLYVDCIALADREPPKKYSFPLPELTGQCEARNMAIDIPLDQVLERRRRKFTRKPIQSARPRADITCGETAMPELEEIYFQRNETHLEAMQRYGTCGWFLVIPREVCGDNFQELRKAVEKDVCASLEDDVCFVGWAEGTENYYIDFITVDGRVVLEFLSKCFDGIPECENIRCSTFYWNSPLRTLNYAEELKQYQKTVDTAGPVKELVDMNMRAALEKLVSATQWEDMDIPKPNVQWDGDEGTVAFVDDPADMARAYEEADQAEDGDWDADVSPDEDPYAQFSELFTKSPDDDAFTTMLKTMACMFAGRELEDPEDEDDEEDYDAFEDDSDLDDFHDEASTFRTFQKHMEDPQFAAVMKEVAKRAAAGPPDKQQPADEDDWDDDDVTLIPPDAYGAFLDNKVSFGQAPGTRHVHNTKRKGLSRKKDKNKRKKKKK